MTDSSCVLSTRDLCKSFGALAAVSDVSFQLRRGELCAIIGPNGAGKSTFFSLLIGRLRPTTGSIVINGVETSNLAAHKISRLGVSLAFQITNIFPTLSVADNLRMSAQRRVGRLNPFRPASGDRNVEARIDAVLPEIGLGSKRGEIAANLSHGEQKYLEIGIALASDPQLLLLDEPTAGMSSEETSATARLIRKLAERISIILVEHDMDVVMGIADRVTVLHHGRIIAEGTPAEIRANDEVQRVYLRTGHAAA